MTSISSMGKTCLVSQPFLKQFVEYLKHEKGRYRTKEDHLLIRMGCPQSFIDTVLNESNKIDIIKTVCYHLITETKSQGRFR